MLAIEKDYLNFFEQHICAISSGREDYASLVQQIPTIPITQITTWNANHRLLTFYYLTEQIFNNLNLAKIYTFLATCQNTSKSPDDPQPLFHAVLSSYYEFFHRIYHIYFLSRLYFILNHYSKEEIKTISLDEIYCQNKETAKTQPFITHALPYKNKLEQEKERSSNALWFEIDIYLYHMKTSYQAHIATLLLEPTTNQSYQTLIKRLKKIPPESEYFFLTQNLLQSLKTTFKQNANPPQSEYFQYSLML